MTKVVDQIPKKSSEDIRLVTFNVCGVRNVFKYHPWCENRTLEYMFSTLQADIIGFQELKLSKADVDSSITSVPGYDSFVSVPVVKKGYSGVALYIRRGLSVGGTALRVVRAEEGITGRLKSRDRPGKTYKELYEEEQAGGAADSTEPKWAIGAYPDMADSEAAELDSEGRAVTVELSGGVVVICVYCPANTGGDKEEFRNEFIRVMLERVQLLGAMGKRVILMGDLNIAKDLIDSAEGITQWKKEGRVKVITPSEAQKYSSPDGAGRAFESMNESAVAEWKTSTYPRDLLNRAVLETAKSEQPAPHKLIDVIRFHHGRAQYLYTCWNILKNCRPGNYGSRIDYILATANLLPSISPAGAHIMPYLNGSDHCPVYADFRLGLLQFEEPQMAGDVVPALSSASKSSKSFFQNQRSGTGPLDMFFKKNAQSRNSPASSESPSSDVTENSKQETPEKAVHVSASVKEEISQDTSRQGSGSTTSGVKSTPFEYKSAKKNTGKKRGNQYSLDTFILGKKAKPEQSGTSSAVADDGNSSENPSEFNSLSTQSQEFAENVAWDEESDSSATRKPDRKVSMNSLTAFQCFQAAKLTAPLCSGHREPCILKVAKTPSNPSNKNRRFWICSKPYGDFDHEPEKYRCKFFKWAS